jgi:hypothetical protein
MGTTILFDTFLPLYYGARCLAVALELLQQFLNDDSFSSTDIPPSILCSLLWNVLKNISDERMEFRSHVINIFM